MALTNDQITANNFKDFFDKIVPYMSRVHAGFTPVGTVISVMGVSAPVHYVKCDGTVYNISRYPELAYYFQSQFGTKNHFGGDGTTTFAVPDLQGEFLRGTGTNSHENQGSGANVGVHQDGTGHRAIRTNNYPDIYTAYVNGDSGVLNYEKLYKSGTTDGKDAYMRMTKGTDVFNRETHYTARPTNTSVLFCIATKNIYTDVGCDYSTDEQVVGSWIDGKPLYQKTFISSFSGNVIQGNIVDTFTGGAAHIDTAVNAFVCCTTNSGANKDFNGYLIFAVRTQGNDVILVTKTTLDDVANVRVTIQYTKTTD